MNTRPSTAGLQKHVSSSGKRKRQILSVGGHWTSADECRCAGSHDLGDG